MVCANGGYFTILDFCNRMFLAVTKEVCQMSMWMDHGYTQEPCPVPGCGHFMKWSTWRPNLPDERKSVRGLKCSNKNCKGRGAVVGESKCKGVVPMEGIWNR